MKFTLVSDVHVDLNPWKWECLDPFSYDTGVLVVAGDISNDVWEVSRWLKDARHRFEHVIWVPGNHDFYNIGLHQTRLYDPVLEDKWPYPRDMQGMLDHYARWCGEHGVIFMHRSRITLNGVTFVGATGWHDYRAGEPYATEDQIKVWYDCLNDTQIRWNKNAIRPDHLAPFDAGVRDWEHIRDSVSSATGPVVVITHHLPHRRLSWQRPHDRIWTMLHGSFVNTRMEFIQDPRIRYWIYGHTHQRNMLDINGMTYVCNAKGYRGENDNWSPIMLEV